MRRVLNIPLLGGIFRLPAILLRLKSRMILPRTLAPLDLSTIVF